MIIDSPSYADVPLLRSLWKEAFGDAEAVFAVTITSNLSGSYAAARTAAED